MTPAVLPEFSRSHPGVLQKVSGMHFWASSRAFGESFWAPCGVLRVFSSSHPGAMPYSANGAPDVLPWFSRRASKPPEGAREDSGTRVGATLADSRRAPEGLREHCSQPAGGFQGHQLRDFGSSELGFREDSGRSPPEVFWDNPRRPPGVLGESPGRPAGDTSGSPFGHPAKSFGCPPPVIREQCRSPQTVLQMS